MKHRQVVYKKKHVHKDRKETTHVREMWRKHTSSHIYIYREREREREQDLGTVLRYCSLGSLFKILPCVFFFMRWKYIF